MSTTEINPFRELKECHDWTFEDMSKVFDVSYPVINYLLNAGNNDIPDRVLDTLDELGYDSDKFEEKYFQFREAERERLLEEAKIENE